jgi:hypothetical protein
LIEAARAGAGAGCGFEECLFGHDGDRSLRLAPSAKVVGIPRRGAGGLAARGALVKKLFVRNGKKPLERVLMLGICFFIPGEEYTDQSLWEGAPKKKPQRSSSTESWKVGNLST